MCRMATLGVDGVHSESVTLLGSYYREFAEWPLTDYARSKPGAFPSVFFTFTSDLFAREI